MALIDLITEEVIRVPMTSRTKLEVIHEVNMGSAVYTTPVARDGVLYIASRNKLFAISDK